MKVLNTILLMVLVLVSISTLTIASSTDASSYFVVVVTETYGKTWKNVLLHVKVSYEEVPDIKFIDINTVYITDEHGTPLYFNASTTPSRDVLELFILIPEIQANSTKLLYVYYGGKNPYKEYALNLNELLTKFNLSTAELTDDFSRKREDLWYWTDLWTVANGTAYYTSDREASRYPRAPESLISKDFTAYCSPYPCRITFEAKSEGIPAYDMRISWFTGDIWVTISFIMWKEKYVDVEIRMFDARGRWLSPTSAFERPWGLMIKGVDIREWHRYTIELKPKVVKICIEDNCLEVPVKDPTVTSKITRIALGSKGKSRWDNVSVYRVLIPYFATAVIRSYEIEFFENLLIPLKNGLNRSFEELSMHISILNSSIMSLNANLTSLNKSIVILSENLDTIAKLLESLKENYSMVMSKIAVLNVSLNRLNRMLLENISTLTSRIDSLSNRLNEIRTSIDDLLHRIEELNTAIIKTRIELGNLTKAYFDALKALRQEYKADVSELRKRLAESISNVYANLTKMIGSMHSNLTQMLWSTAANLWNRHEKDVETLRNLLNTEIGSLRQVLKSNITQVSKKCTELVEKTRTELNAIINDRVNKLSSELDKISTTVSELSSKLKDLEARLREISTMVDDLTRGVDELRNEIAKSQSYVNKLKSDILSYIDSSIDKCRSEMNSLMSSLRSMAYLAIGLAIVGIALSVVALVRKHL